MKTKPKRIRALKCDMTVDGVIYLGHDKSCTYTELCYLLKQSDIRALAEQFVDDAEREMRNPKHRLRCRLDTALYVLRRAGMTPGKSRQKTRQSVGKGGAQ